ncbi:membrane protein [Bacteroidia bacterium]|nr:membrane protein [Bacteroidia bacterium]
MTILLFSQCKDKATNTPGETNTPDEAGSQDLSIVYVDVDSLLVHFNFYNGLVSALEDKASKQNSSIKSSAQKFENEVLSFQQKAQNNAFLSQERMTQEQTRLQRMQDDIQQRAAQMQQELALDQAVLQQQLSDSLVLGIKEFNTPKKYSLILTKSGNSILYADKQFDITNDVIEFLNKRFKSEKE